MPLRFLLVGAWNFCFGYIAFAGLYWLLNQSLSEGVIVLLSSILGITNSFIFHRWLTYQNKGLWWRAYLRFYVVYGLQIALNMGLLVLFVTVLRLNAYAMQLLISTLLTIASYWGHKFYSFH